MSFRKRNVGLSSPSAQPKAHVLTSGSTLAAGVRPSPLDGRAITSTGTPSLDDLLGGHAGLALGHSILVEESGPTEFGGVLLRCYAAEGIVQGHKVHVVGVGEQWGRELPGLVEPASSHAKQDVATPVIGKEKMKIAWRYERLRDFGASPPSARAPSAVNRDSTTGFSDSQTSITAQDFCHCFDLTKRLTIPDQASLNFVPIYLGDSHKSTFTTTFQHLKQQILSSPSHTIHRIIIPTILSPALYPIQASYSDHILQFLHSLRALLRQFSTQLTAMITIPLMLHPRSTGLTRWMELLSDGVVELSPFPRTSDTGLVIKTSRVSTAQEDKPQGMVKFHRLPVVSERGGGSNIGGDLAFTLSRKVFSIKPLSLPPIEGGLEAEKGVGLSKPQIEF